MCSDDFREGGVIVKVEEGDWVIILGSEIGYRIGYVEDVRPNWLDNDFEDVTVHLGHSTLEIKSFEISAVLAVKPEVEDEPEEVIPSPEEVAEALKTMYVPPCPLASYSRLPQFPRPARGYAELWQG
jgi:hypothetical protein